MECHIHFLEKFGTYFELSFTDEENLYTFRGGNSFKTVFPSHLEKGGGGAVYS